MCPFWAVPVLQLGMFSSDFCDCVPPALTPLSVALIIHGSNTLSPGFRPVLKVVPFAWAVRIRAELPLRLLVLDIVLGGEVFGIVADGIVDWEKMRGGTCWLTSNDQSYVWSHLIAYQFSVWNHYNIILSSVKVRPGVYVRGKRGYSKLILIPQIKSNHFNYICNHSQIHPEDNINDLSILH